MTMGNEKFWGRPEFEVFIFYFIFCFFVNEKVWSTPEFEKVIT